MPAMLAITVLAFASAPVAHAQPDIIIPTVLIENANNPADTNGNGAVSYNYSIGMYEVTNAQYCAFLNSVAKSDPNGLYNAKMGATYAENRRDERGGITQSGSDGNYEYAVIDGWANKPVNYVSFYDAARFCNWLTNGATTDPNSTETGVYTMSDGVPKRNNEAWLAGGYVLPSDDEWYKAAYYNSTSGQYTPYATGTTYAGLSHYSVGWGAGLAEVGTYAPEQNGTYDMTGNVREWTDTDNRYDNSAGVGARGGDFYTAYNDEGNKDRYNQYPTANTEFPQIGFRISQFASVPEPGTYGLLGGAAALLGAIALRRRSRRH